MRKNITKFSKIESTSCDLIFFNRINSYIKKLERVFFLISKRSCVRGNHAHKKCSQFFFSIHGKVILNIKTPNSNKKIVLKSSSNTGILVPPKYWCGVKFINKDSILMVACDKYYDFDDYLGTFNEYKKYLKKL